MSGPTVPVVALIRAKRGCEHKVQALLAGLVEPTRREPGCLRYDLHRDADDPCLFVFFESWASRGDLDRHLGSPHVQRTAAALADDLAQPPQITALKQLR